MIPQSCAPIRFREAEVVTAKPQIQIREEKSAKPSNTWSRKADIAFRGFGPTGLTFWLGLRSNEDNERATWSGSTLQHHHGLVNFAASDGAS